MRRLIWTTVLATLVAAAPVMAQGGMRGGMGGMGGGRGGRGGRGGVAGRSGPALPTEPELAGPPDLQTLALATGMDTLGLAGYGANFITYADSVRPARDSAWVLLQKVKQAREPGGDPTQTRDAMGALNRLWSVLHVRDEDFIKHTLKPALPKKEFKAWQKWHDDEIDQAKKARDQEFRTRMGPEGQGGVPSN